MKYNSVGALLRHYYYFGSIQMNGTAKTKKARIILSLLLCICSVLGCVGCASNAQSTDTGNSTQESTQSEDTPKDSDSDMTPDSGKEDDMTQTKPFIETLTPSNGKRLKIAFIGDSITQGTGASNQATMSYPGQLSKMLNINYLVGNYGKAASYVLPFESPYNKREKRELSYKNTTQYADSIAFKPDIVVITLGVNDIASMFSEKAKEAVKEALIALGRDYEALESVQKVYIATSIRIPNGVRGETYTLGELQKIQRAAAEEGGFGFIDIYSMTHDYLDVMMHFTSDRLHPNDALYKVMAQAYKAALFEQDYTPAVAEKSDTGVVYLKTGGKDTGKGASEEEAVGKLAYAAGLLRESGGTIVVCGNYSLSYETHLPHTDKPITVTSKYNGVDYSSAGAGITLTHHLYLNGDYTIENIKLSLFKRRSNLILNNLCSCAVTDNFITCAFKSLCTANFNSHC